MAPGFPTLRMLLLGPTTALRDPLEVDFALLLTVVALLMMEL